MKNRILFLSLTALLLWSLPANSFAQDIQQLQLRWIDNSTNEDGFKIERGPVVAGPFTQINTTVPNAQNYVDQGLKNATTYCYQVRAYNLGGNSAYAGPVCAKTRAILDVTKVGSGVITSAPAGIDCGSTCSANVTADTQVTLAATPATGFIFAGWSGACTGTSSCVLTMNAAKAVTASFATIAPPNGDPSNLTVQ